MTEPSDGSPPPPDPPGAPDGTPAAAAAAKGEKKKKKKSAVRSAWISFIGRIVAQVVGALATIVLGLMIVQRRSGSPDSTNGADSPPPRARTAVAGERAIAVLPFANYSPNGGDAYFADGMTEAVTTDLARLQSVRVISRTSSMRYRGTTKPLRQIAEELDVDLILEGSVLKAGARLRLTVQLIDAKSDEHLWVQTYDRTTRDVLRLQTEMADAIAKELQSAISPAPRQAGEGRPVNPEAYGQYMKGRAELRVRSAASLDDAERSFQKALAFDPDMALAHSGLADTYALAGISAYGDMPPRAAFTRAKESATRALALDSGLAEPHASLATALLFLDWDWAGAEREFKKALEVQPGYALARQWYALLLAGQGRSRESISEGERSVTLDPHSANTHRALAIARYVARDFAGAERAARRALELESPSVATRGVLARALVAQGHAREALSVLTTASPAEVAHAETQAALAFTLRKLGDRGSAAAARDRLLAQRPPPSATALVRLHAGLGEAEQTLGALRRAIDERSDVILLLKTDPLYDELRGAPAFNALLERVRLK